MMTVMIMIKMIMIVVMLRIIILVIMIMTDYYSNMKMANRVMINTMICILMNIHMRT